MKQKILFALALLFASWNVFALDYQPYFPFLNLSYIVYQAPSPIEIDGDIYTEEWQKASWTEDFQDIRGDRFPVKPKYRTRAKMLWDKDYLYVAVELEEPHIWGTVTERDDVIYRDNDIEVFIDPSCCGREYREFEFNALNTQWELLLLHAPNRGGSYYTDWDAKGMRTAVKIYGTLNDPSDTDEKWTFEAAIPLRSLGAAMPGYQWRLTFSRVEWLGVNIENGEYKKIQGKPEENWLWAPTGAIDAHRPERWGWIQFSGIKVGEGSESFNWNNGHEYQEALWTVNNRIHQYRTLTHKMPESFEDLEIENPMNMRYSILHDGVTYLLSVDSDMGITYNLSNEGYIKKTYDRSYYNKNGWLDMQSSNPDRFKDRTPGVNPYEEKYIGIPEAPKTDLNEHELKQLQRLQNIY